MSSNPPVLPVSLPPDLDVKKPKLKLPPGSVDAHAHVFGRPDRYPYAANRFFNPPPGIHLEHYDEMHRVLGAERGVVVHSGAHGTDNSLLIDTLAQSGGRLRGIALINETMSDDDFASLTAAGVRGFRANLVSKIGIQFDSARKLAARVQKFGWHAQFLLDIESFPDLDRQLADFPIEVMIDHMGRPETKAGTGAPGFQALLRLLKSGRGWSKLSAPYRTSREPLPYSDIVPFARALVEAAPDRLVWGTDWPHVNLEAPVPNTGDLTDLLATWVPDEGTRKRILVDNPAKLYGF
jgi:predicted TIM-barrel fold metal-dependent hydrolase